MTTRRRLLRIVFVAVLTIAIGTFGYMVIEGWSFSDAAFMTIITLSTVGYGVVGVLSDAGRFFTMLLILVGVGVIVYSFSTFGEYLVSATMQGQLQRRRTRRMIKKLNNHVVICGYGRVGKGTAKTLRNSRQEVVVIESDQDRVSQAQDDGLIVLEGDASQDEVLHDAGLSKANSIIVTTGEDSLNLFIVLSARTINPDLLIVARANNVANEVKLRRAGADRVVSPYLIGGQHMANIVVRPHVTDFFDVVTLKDGEEIWIEELRIHPGSYLAGSSVGEADIRRKTGVTLIALYRQQEGGNTVPNAETRLEAGDQLLVLGTRVQLAALDKLTKNAA
ncbi:MAG: potassium channel protein [Candidatus Promineifilaceae bacterium]|nr:potassium channel protein [Candidatus Promineifilaceae bacterium]